MKKFLLLFVLQSSFLFAQAPFIQWQKSLGGSGTDKINSIIQTSDGNYIAAGYSNSNDGDVTGAHGGNDCWLVKLDSNGLLLWQKTFGGTGHEGITKIVQTIDGGFIASASSGSSDGDITNNLGSSDVWIIKLDALGNITWQKSYGGTSVDGSSSIAQTTDGGYIISGSSSSYNGNVTGNHGGADAWILKIDAIGTLVWQKVLGGYGLEIADDIAQTSDGGYIVAAYSSEVNGDITFNHGLTDYWVVKLSSTGTIEWQKSLGGSGSERLYTIKQTIDGGYILAGSSTSTDGDITGNHGTNDCWIVKINATGTIIWQKSIGGTDVDSARSVFQNEDGTYIIAAYSASTNGDLTTNQGNKDAWIVKLSTTGTILWQKSFGGTGLDEIYSISKTADGNYILGGNSNSNDGDISGNHGGEDYWIAKLGPNLSTNKFSINEMQIYPNPANNNLTLKVDYFEPSQKITITDITGKILYTQSVQGLQTIINTSSLTSGIYFLNVENGTDVISKKFIKE